MIQYLQQNYICEFIFAAKNYYAWQLAVVLIKIQLREIYENTNTVHISKLKQTSFWKDLCIHIDMCVYTLLVWPTGNHAYLIMITYTYIYITILNFCRVGNNPLQMRKSMDFSNFQCYSLDFSGQRKWEIRGRRHQGENYPKPCCSVEKDINKAGKN